MNWPPRRRHKKLTSRDLVAAEVRDGHTQSVRGRWFLHGHEHRNDRGACGLIEREEGLLHRKDAKDEPHTLWNWRSS